MFLDLLTGLPVILLCLLLQAIVVTICLRRYSRVRRVRQGRETWLLDFTLLSMVMLLTLLGNLVQMAIWAALFMMLGEFANFHSALYHSAVNFTTLGYGDVVMSKEWRLLGPLEAANGILMFGVSTALITAAVMDIIKLHAGRLQQGD
jgi:hypothetical protein